MRVIQTFQDGKKPNNTLPGKTKHFTMGGNMLEKQDLQLSRPSSRSWKRAASTWILATAGLWALGSSVRRLRATTPRDYGWVDIEPSRELRWHACYDGEFECARLDLPMDWVEPSDEQRVYLAVIRLQAKTKKDYRGPVFVNPGVRISACSSARTWLTGCRDLVPLESTSWSITEKRCRPSLEKTTCVWTGRWLAALCPPPR